ncbi:predicted protein [Pyrenophora tritici-repentis Pt-1C-BFP]|uniref:Uncharacterized protein n=1 Tax=Pyrenophora tritici-repentis (strain Pt-1C-BFP) TaxID=426418 RepID=B2VYS0_PYRTR|nr:uncharacterized protein PTRG_02560 [Pyrenophora tritici-repentis Pt-1C-BFP]EDU45083.1 predicted protein [Pyrenophora tritici-repentis Pt-1C-BFP]
MSEWGLSGVLSGRCVASRVGLSEASVHYNTCSTQDDGHVLYHCHTPWSCHVDSPRCKYPERKHGKQTLRGHMKRQPGCPAVPVSSPNLHTAARYGRRATRVRREALNFASVAARAKLGSTTTKLFSLPRHKANESRRSTMGVHSGRGLTLVHWSTRELKPVEQVKICGTCWLRAGAYSPRRRYACEDAVWLQMVWVAWVGCMWLEAIARARFGCTSVTARAITVT